MNLNKEQSKIAMSPQGWKRIVAGAGSGKTTVIMHRLIHLINSGIKPQRIFCITFTKKAAGEMKNRLARLYAENNLFPKDSGQNIYANFPWVGTFHALALSLLRKEEKFQKHRIIHGKKMQSLRWELAKGYKQKTKSIPLTNWIFKGEQDLLMQKEEFYHEFVSQIRLFKEKEKLLEFDDFVKEVIKLYQEKPDILKILQDSIDAVLVDEFQDTNPEQVAFLRLMLKPEHDFLAVGDDYQAIYAFRGSDSRIFIDFNRDFPSARTYKLRNNYRSYGNIIRCCNNILKLNRHRIKKKMKSLKLPGEKPGFVFFTDRAQMIAWIRDHFIKNFLNEVPDGSKTLAILVRLNSLAEEISLALSGSPGKNIIVSTVHKSKGLEYDYVLVAGIEEGIFPHRDNDLEEERRLLFVAASRARQSLTFALVCKKTDVEKGFFRELGIGYMLKYQNLPDA